MKILLDIKDEKASFILEVLKNFKYVKAEPFSKADTKFFEELKEAVDEVNLIKAGKAKGIPADDWLNGL
ncbi:hypothetical protein [Mucilaginibacter glaciei]|uniref:Uncharacterized protein n=1 Tax=Mucilaginibacter glaciei TaxID=2772109 RepID=A0A926S3P8_9SPHI|nr:hypothetical protein [Mucilaginibacter glaciei]MBD1395453.1 hypothetical protein [Mucilaginibacter glaciei]